MKVLVCGDRNWSDVDTTFKALAKLPRDVLVIHGAARGADRIADQCARKLGLQVRPVPADWDKQGKAAGPLRNKKMIAMKPDGVLAFHDDLVRSKGTRNCVKLAQKEGIPVTVIKSGETHDLPAPLPMQQELTPTKKKLLSALADDCLTVSEELEAEARLLADEIRKPSEFREQRLMAAEQQMKTAAATVKDFLKELKAAQC